MRAYVILLALFFLNRGLIAQDVFSLPVETDIIVSDDTLCLGETIHVSFGGTDTKTLQWDFGLSSTVVQLDDIYEVTYTTPGEKIITVSIEDEEPQSQLIFVEAVPDAVLEGSIASGYAAVFHYGLALTSGTIEEYQSGTWYIKNGQTNNTGFVGDVSEDKVGFYNFDYTTKTVCRKVESKKGTCIADEACVQITRYDCTCPIPLERDREVCISDTQLYVQENCCFSPVPEIGDTTYWESQNNTPFVLSSPISVITKITKPGNYKYTFHFVNPILEQVEDYVGEFNIKVKNNSLSIEVTEGDSIGTCEEKISINAEASDEGEYTWSVLSNNATITSDMSSVVVVPLNSPSEVKILSGLDNGVCNVAYDTTIVHFVGVFPDVNEQSVVIGNTTDQIQLFSNPIASQDDSFTGLWAYPGPAVLDDEGWVSGLEEGDNIFYYTISQDLCSPKTDSVVIKVDPVVTDVLYTSNSEVAYFPNPVSEQLNVSFENLSNHGPFTVEIYDLIGHLVYVSGPSNQQNQTIDVSSLPNGMYMVNVKYQGNSSQFRILK